MNLIVDLPLVTFEATVGFDIGVSAAIVSAVSVRVRDNSVE
jgi:hypothetical protein